jgi:hypothetical protein
MKYAFVLMAIVVMLIGCRGRLTPSEPTVRVARPQIKGKSLPAQEFGKARIAVGMTKEEVLVQIELSRSQYKDMKSNTDTQIYISQPSEETIESDSWSLMCPSRNSHLLGGGGGIVLQLTFTNGKISAIEQLPWLGA